MGGYGSGQRYGPTKRTTTQMARLDVLELHRAGHLRGAKALNHDYAVKVRGREPQDVKALIRLEWTPCHYGGCRPWFTCPRCGRRSRHIYLGVVAACRVCHDLAYQCQRETDTDRALRKARKINERLGGTSDLVNPPLHKPKGMHWRTFDRLTLEGQTAYAAALHNFMRRYPSPGRQGSTAL